MKAFQGPQKKIGHPLCDFCLRDESCNKMGDHEKMLHCKDCEAKAHPSCMEYSKALALRALSYPWQCVECKTCTVCCSAQDGANILFCDGCDKAYHMKCHQPEVTEKPEGKWICAMCSSKESFTNGDAGHSDDVEDGVSPHGKAFERPITSNGISDAHFPSHNGGVPPNLAEWSSDQVSHYFKNVGFPEQAHIFIQEEIDGKSLLLLKRSDVISNLTLKLGPAVKIYEHIKKLQNNSSSFNKYENGL